MSTVPPSATLGESPSLKLLSEWATPGLWKTGFAHWGRIQIFTDRTIGELNAYAGLGGREKELNAEQDANGKFICALVNAFRAGELSTVSETAPKGQHLSHDLTEALRIMGRLASIISATPKEAFKDWAAGPEIPYDMVRVAEAFIAKPRSVFAPSATRRTWMRCPYHDRRIANGDDYAGDAWVCWTAVGQKPEDA